MLKEAHEANRLSWNEATKAHNSHKGDQAAMFRSGKSTLYQEDKILLGDITGLNILHLQCNSGQDTLSIKLLGCKSITGVDISDDAIQFAQKLSQDSNVQATFLCHDIYDYFDKTDPNQFDIVYISYGAICWLSDLDVWGRGIHKVLRPGGKVVILEFHPILSMYNFKDVRDYPYSSGGVPVIEESGIRDYVAMSGEALVQNGTYEEGIKDFKNPHPSHEFVWGLAEIIMGIVRSGLTLKDIKEYGYSNGLKAHYNMTMEKMEDGKIRWYPEAPMRPCMYSIVAIKP